MKSDEKICKISAQVLQQQGHNCGVMFRGRVPLLLAEYDLHPQTLQSVA